MTLAWNFTPTQRHTSGAINQIWFSTSIFLDRPRKHVIFTSLPFLQIKFVELFYRSQGFLENNPARGIWLVNLRPTKSSQKLMNKRFKKTLEGVFFVFKVRCNNRFMTGLQTDQLPCRCVESADLITMCCGKNTQRNVRLPRWNFFLTHFWCKSQNLAGRKMTGVDPRGSGIKSTCVWIGGHSQCQHNMCSFFFPLEAFSKGFGVFWTFELQNQVATMFKK